MSHLEGDELQEPEFKWLKEKAGQRFINTHFYESFLYEGVEYSLYDSVYLQVESEHAPYIGKLVRIWEEADKSKMIRVQWFFRPSEILYHLGDTEVLENELFLASGCGIGLVNVSPLLLSANAMLSALQRMVEIHNLLRTRKKWPIMYFTECLMSKTSRYWINSMIQLVGLKEKRTWLKLGNLSWESMKTAHDEGKLVLLQNLDPTLTSAEVKDIIWCAFEEKCMAKMVQHSAMSSPHNGQALLVFDTREVAERVLKGLEDRCLMLQNQRPLVGCTVVLLPGHPRKQTAAFVGHLSIDKVRRDRKMKEAVSTSHFSQPNTIEYEMAMEWWILQSKSNIWCLNLFEQHKVELKKLVADLQVK